jgi:hypothetical protein
MVNRGWVREGQMLERQEIDKMFALLYPVFMICFALIYLFSRHIPTVVVQGTRLTSSCISVFTHTSLDYRSLRRGFSGTSFSSSLMHA